MFSGCTKVKALGANGFATCADRFTSLEKMETEL